MATRNDELADIAMQWFLLSKKDRQYAINLLISRGLVYFDDHFQLRSMK